MTLGKVQEPPRKGDMLADDENLARDCIDTMKKSTGTLHYASKGIGLEGNTKKIKCILLSYRQNTGENLNIKITN
jgi:hypothetical protein